MDWFIHEHNNGIWRIKENKKPEIGDIITAVNIKGGRHKHVVQPGEEIFQSTWNEIFYNKYLNNSDSKCGWISPRGEFFGCNTFDHADCIYTISGMFEYDAERAGWIKIYYDNTLKNLMPTHFRPDGYGWWIGYDRKPTTEQIDTLLKRGFNVD